eukprot:g16375.t1
MPPSKRASVEAMKAAFTLKLQDACGKGSMLVPAVRIETHFEKDNPDDMVESNEMRLLVCADGHGKGTSFETSALPVAEGEKQDRTWYCHSSWQESELREAYEGPGILSLLMPDPEYVHVYYVIFKESGENLARKMHTVDESTKRLVKSITDPGYNLTDACTTGYGDKKYAVKRPRKTLLEEAFRIHMHNELLPYFRVLFAAENSEDPKTPVDAFDPMAKANRMDKESSFVYVTCGTLGV